MHEFRKFPCLTFLTAHLKKSWDANQSVACPFTFSKNWHIGTEIILNNVFHIQNGFINLWKKLFATLNWKVAVYFIHCSKQLHCMFPFTLHEWCYSGHNYMLSKSHVIVLLNEVFILSYLILRLKDHKSWCT